MGGVILVNPAPLPPKKQRLNRNLNFTGWFLIAKWVTLPYSHSGGWEKIRARVSTPRDLPKELEMFKSPGIIIKIIRE